MNYDVTLLSRASQSVARLLPADITRLEDHIEPPIARAIRVRQAASDWLLHLAERVAPRPVESECDELFETISALLAEPVCEVLASKTASHARCSCVLFPWSLQAPDR